MPPIIPPDFWQSERERLLAVLLPHLEEAAAVGALLAGRKAPALSFDPDLHNRQAAAWARQHADELLGQLESTTGQTVGDIIGGWAETSGATMGELKAALREEFKTMAVERADRIAVTEVTRAYAEGERITYQAAGIKRWTWRTNRDELVCKTCGPLNDKEVDIGRPFGKTPKGKDITEPPAHPNCRCWVAPVVDKAERPAPPPPPPVVAQPAAVAPVAPTAPRRLTGAEVRAKVNEINREVRREIAEAEHRHTQAIDEMNAAYDERRKWVEQAGGADLDARVNWTPEQEEQYRALRLATEAAEQRLMEESDKLVSLYADGAARQRQALYVDTPLQFQTDIKATNKSVAARAREGIAEFARMVGVDLPTSTPIPVKGTRNSRSFFSPADNSINMSNRASVSVVIHELGHALERNNPEVLRLALEFYDRRTQGENLEWLGRGYKRDEKTRKDQFPDAYMGKEYKNAAGTRTATEIVSMGMQRMWEDPAGFAQRDPDYFDFIAGLLRGN